MYMYVLLPVENGDDGDNGHLREEDKARIGLRSDKVCETFC